MADERERLNELTAAAERGDAQAKYNYANELYKAAEGGLVKAQRELGIILRDGNGIPKNDKEAVQWFRKAAEQDDRDAQWGRWASCSAMEESVYRKIHKKLSNGFAKLWHRGTLRNGGTQRNNSSSASCCEMGMVFHKTTKKLLSG